MNTSPRRLVCGILILGGALAGPAAAATPPSGSVSTASPRVDWTGEVTNSWTFSRPAILLSAVGEEEEYPCVAPTCDTFDLEVVDSKDLTIGTDAPEADDQVIMRVTAPDGTSTTAVENAGGPGKHVTLKFKNAAKGAWIVDYWNYYVIGTQSYTGFAQLGTPAPAAPPPAGTPTPPPSGGGGGGGSQPPPSGGGSAPAPKAEIKLTVKVRAASARKLARSRKLPVRVTVSREVVEVVATLKAGKKVVGKGKRGKTSGTATLNLKPTKKLKAGRYSLTVSARSADGVIASKTIRVKVKK